MISESNEKTKDQIILEEYDIKNINKETLKDYRIRFKIHKGEAHEWNKIDDEEFLYRLNALDRQTKKFNISRFAHVWGRKGYSINTSKLFFGV